MGDLEKITLFHRWYVEPIKRLEKIPNGDGGWVVFIVGLALYERLIIARLKSKNIKSDEETIYKAMCKDLDISEKERSIFWGMCRNGLLHQAMPKIGPTRLFFKDDFSDKPVFSKINEINMICINPMKFTNRIINEFLSEPNLIDMSESNPLARIV
jgi:hypothetical protein